MLTRCKNGFYFLALLPSPVQIFNDAKTELGAFYPQAQHNDWVMEFGNKDGDGPI